MAQVGGHANGLAAGGGVDEQLGGAAADVAAEDVAGEQVAGIEGCPAAGGDALGRGGAGQDDDFGRSRRSRRHGQCRHQGQQQERPDHPGDPGHWRTTPHSPKHPIPLLFGQSGKLRSVWPHPPANRTLRRCRVTANQAVLWPGSMPSWPAHPAEMLTARNRGCLLLAAYLWPRREDSRWRRRRPWPAARGRRVGHDCLLLRAAAVVLTELLGLDRRSRRVARPAPGPWQARRWLGRPSAQRAAGASRCRCWTGPAQHRSRRRVPRHGTAPRNLAAWRRPRSAPSTPTWLTTLVRSVRTFSPRTTAVDVSMPSGCASRRDQLAVPTGWQPPPPAPTIPHRSSGLVAVGCAALWSLRPATQQAPCQGRWRHLPPRRSTRMLSAYVLILTEIGKVAHVAQALN